jgi:hypothetical protein
MLAILIVDNVAKKRLRAVWVDVIGNFAIDLEELGHKIRTYEVMLPRDGWRLFASAEEIDFDVCAVVGEHRRLLMVNEAIEKLSFVAASQP